MTVRPILFTAPMVRALLDGRKTQTRRLLRWIPTRVLRLQAEPDDLNLSFSGLRPERLRTNGTPDGVWRLVSRGRGGCWEERAHVRTYAPGDLLWVRETWVADGHIRADRGGQAGVRYVATDDIHPLRRKRPGIHMPRWASRITLVVTEVRVQRLQEISEADAIAEGTPRMSDEIREDFAALWTSINGKRPGATWTDNPWIVALTFKVRRANVDTVLETVREVAA